jgi:hypothetical protein
MHKFHSNILNFNFILIFNFKKLLIIYLSNKFLKKSLQQILPELYSNGINLHNLSLSILIYLAYFIKSNVCS